MNIYAYNMPIPELIEKLDEYMVSLGYAPSTLRHYRFAWNALKNLALAEGSSYFSKELGFKLLREHYKIDPYAANLSVYKSSVRRAVMVLLEFQLSGTIAGRVPKGEYNFPSGFITAGNQFLEYLKECNLRSSTIRNYKKQIFNATSFFTNHEASDFESLDNNQINLYIKTFAGCSKSYISCNIRSLSKFLSFAYDQGYTNKKFTFPSISVYKDRRVPEYYTADEVSKILAAIDRSNALGKRNYAMVLLAAKYGLRISDITSLKLSELDFENNQISIIQQKTGKPLTLDMLPDVGWALIDYLKNGRPNIECDNVFLRHRHPYGPFARTDNMQQMIQQYALSAGVSKLSSKKHVGFHMMRYSLASDLIQQGISLPTISSILGHSDLNVTTVYTQLDIPHLRTCALEVPL